MEVEFRTKEKLRFRPGWTSLLPTLLPNIVIEVTEINDSRMTDERAYGLLKNLKACESYYHVKSITAYDTKLLIEDTVIGTIIDWLEDQHLIWLQELGAKYVQRNWITYITRDNTMSVYLRDFALGLMFLHGKKCQFGGKITDLLVTKRGLKMMTLFGIVESDMTTAVLRDINTFRQLFVIVVSYPEWRKNNNYKPTTFDNPFSFETPIIYDPVGDEDRKTMQLPVEVCQTLDHFLLADTLDTVSGNSFLNHPYFFIDEDSMLFLEKSYFNLLHSKPIDPVVFRVNQTMRVNLDDWKSNIVDLDVRKMVGHADFQRKSSYMADRFAKGLENYFPKDPMYDDYLFTDMLKIFHNAQNHIDKNSTRLKSRVEIYSHVEKSLRGAPIKIYGFLLNEFINELSNGFANRKRAEFLRNFLGEH